MTSALPHRPPKPPAAVLFDLDGTLVDSLEDLALGTDRMLSELSLPTAGVERVRTWVGRGVEALLRQALAWAVDDEATLDAALLARAARAFDHHYRAVNGRSTRPLPGAAPLLDALARAAVPLALVTNKSRRFTLPLLRSLGWEQRFASIVCGDDATHTKPDPAPIRQALIELDVAAADAVMVGDSDYDVIASQAADVFVIRVGQGYGPEVASARADAELATLFVVAEMLGLPAATAPAAARASSRDTHPR
jgi:phosphoglycolate phosphatase